MPLSAAIHDNNGGTENHCDGKLTPSVVIICIVAASAGLIFGYDIGISGGVTSMEPFLQKFFPSVLKKMAEATPNQYCIFDSQLLTLFTSSFYLSGLVASLLAGRITIAGGRKATLLLGGVIFLVGSAVGGFATNVAMLILGRLLLGFGVGFTNQAAPVYLAEMAPPSYRGALVTAFQFFLSGGVVVASLVNVFVAPLGAISWRLAIGIAAVPAAVMTLGVLFIPDTPTSLLQRGKVNEARQSLIQIRGTDSDTEPEFNELIRSSQATQGNNRGPYAKIFERRYRPQLVMSMAISSCQQLTGISAVAFYAPVLFRSIGFGSNGALLGAAILGGVNLGSTVVSTILVDRVGRRFLFLEGGIQILICE
ncbi:Major facilitator, sugar transporter-like, partial [Dillenia turbinata]